MMAAASNVAATAAPYTNVPLAALSGVVLAMADVLLADDDEGEEGEEEEEDDVDEPDEPDKPDDAGGGDRDHDGAGGFGNTLLSQMMVY